jgi:serine protease Do
LLSFPHAQPVRADQEQPSFSRVIDEAQRKVVKIFGAGGAQRLEGYQSGLVVSPEGHVLTVWSYVLDGETATVVLHDGRRYEAQLVGADPSTGIAILLLPHEGEPLPHFDLSLAAQVGLGDRILALSNLYRVASGNEPVSAQRGLVSAIAPLDARRGAAPALFRGEVYMLDAITNNPGAAGGAVVDLDGRLVGMIGRELRSATTNAWLNYCLPVDAFRESLAAILAGRFVAQSPAGDDLLKPDDAWSLDELGIVLVPDVLTNTPPFIDAVRPGTPAAAENIRPDDLLVLIEGQLVPSCRAVREALALRDVHQPVRLTVLRDGELAEITLTQGAR